MSIAVQVVGDASVNPKHVEILDSRVAGELGAKQLVNLNSSSLLRVAAAAQNVGFRVQDLQVDDADEAADDDLKFLKDELVAALRAGNLGLAYDLLMDWPGDLTVSGLRLMHMTQMHLWVVNRTGRIESMSNARDELGVLSDLLVTNPKLLSR